MEINYLKYAVILLGSSLESWIHVATPYSRAVHQQLMLERPTGLYEKHMRGLFAIS
jgi:hypothetical protein